MSKKTKIFIILLLIIISILFFLQFFFASEKKQTPFLSPTPSPLLPQGDNKIIESQKIIKENQYPLLDQTPYKTPLFEVSYVGPLKLKVLMFTKKKEEVKKEVFLWLSKNGVSPESHKIEYVFPSFP